MRIAALFRKVTYLFLFFMLTTSVVEAYNLRFLKDDPGPVVLLTDRDFDLINEAAKRAIETEGKEPTTWSNSDNGNAGSVLSSPAEVLSDRPCRTLTVIIRVKDEQTRRVVRVCQQKNQTWRIVQ